MATTMTPSKNTVPFVTGTLLSTPIIDKINRGIRDLEVNYGLQDILTWSMVRENQAWTFTLLHVNQTKPIVTVTNKSMLGLNTFLATCGKYIAAHYGAQVTKQRKTA
jgi:hypothetical protein